MDEFDHLENSKQAGLNYLVNCVKEDGSFIYEIDSATGIVSKSYNILRHAGSLYVIYQWLNYSLDPNKFFRIESAALYLISHIQYLVENENIACVVEKNEAKLGGAALTILALTERYKIQSSSQQLNEMRGLANFIVSMQKLSGEFKSKLLYKENEIANFESVYYPGEAILALIRLYQIDNNPVWLETAELGINFLIKNPVLNRDGTHGHNHWFVIALAEFYFLKESPKVYNESWLIINSTINAMEQNFQSGGNTYTYSSTEMSTRGEAIMALLKLEIALGRRNENPRLQGALIEIINYCLKFQIKDDCFWGGINLKGGIKKGYFSEKVRIDYVQHFMQILLLMDFFKPNL